MMKKITYNLLYVILLFMSTASYAQENDEGKEEMNENAIKLFLDCQYCDLEFYRQNLTFVNHVRDRNVSDVHLLFTSQTTGSGGTEYSLTFYGQKDFEGVDDSLTFVTTPLNTSDEIRQGIINRIKLGLIRSVSHSDFSNKILIEFTEEKEPIKMVDKWKSWVFDVSMSGWFNGEQSYNNYSLHSSISADRITPEWKFEMYLSQNYNETNFIFDEETIKSISRSQYGSVDLVKSISDHLSVGAFVDLGSSIYNNKKLGIGFQPGIEYNLFPYKESTKRQLRFKYLIGTVRNFYNELTMYNKLEETLFQQNLAITFKQIEKWGSISFGLTGKTYLHDLTKNNLRINSSLSLRLMKGLSFRVSGTVSFIRDQISLPMNGVSEEDMLLRQKQIATNFSFWGSAGITYTFGSIYNNVVNPRFSG